MGEGQGQDPARRPAEEEVEGRTETSAQVSVGSSERSTGLPGESPQQAAASGHPRLQGPLVTLWVTLLGYVSSWNS